MLAKQYLPKEFESQIYTKWENDDAFSPKEGLTGKTYYLPIPPPNVTGNLHI